MIIEKIIKSLEGVNNGLFKPKKDINIDIAKDILNNLVEGTYKKENYFSDEEYKASSIFEKDSIKDNEYYQVFRLRAITPFSETISVTSGGIVYDEPVFAVMAALNINKSKSVIPTAKNYETYKLLLQKAEKGLKKPDFKPDFFEKAVAFFDKNGDFYSKDKPLFDVIKIESVDLKSLREQGFSTFSYKDKPTFFELYFNPNLK